MLDDERIDRCERLEKLWFERSVRERRESRKQTALLGSYVEALRGYDEAKLRAEAKPGDSEASQTLIQTQETLDQVREELKQSTRKSATSRSGMT